MRDIMLFVHIMGIAMGVGTSFAFLFMGLSMKNKTKEEAEKVMLSLLSLNSMGRIGLVLLILSGGYLMTPYWSIMGNMPYLIAKLALVVVLIACVGIMEVFTKKAKQNKGGEYLKKLAGIGRITLPVSILIILFAILTFH